MTFWIRRFAGVAAALGCTAAGAHAQAVAGSPFNFDLTAFNSAGTIGYYITPVETANFGATTTYSAAGVNGQNITVSSSESTVGSSITDLITVTTPTNFLTTTTINGTKMTQMDFDLGDVNAGNVPIQTAQINTYSSSGNIIYGTGNSNFALTTNVTLGGDRMSYANGEGVSNGTTAISTIAIHQFSFSITYTAAPEPSSFALAGVGVSALGAMVFRRRKAA